MSAIFPAEFFSLRVNSANPNISQKCDQPAEF